jgi:hypothetical protein
VHLSKRASVLIGLVWLLAALVVALGILVIVFGLPWLLSLGALLD